MSRLEELIKELPPEIQRKFADILEFLLQKKNSAAPIPPKPVPPAPQLEEGGKSHFHEQAQSIAMARAKLVKLYQQAGRQAVRGMKTATKRQFILDYNSGAYPQLFGLLRKTPTSWQTLERWSKKLRQTGDPFELAPRYGKQKGKTAVTEAQARCLRTVAPLYPQRAEAVRAARKMMAAQGIEDTCCVRTYVNFLKRHFATRSRPAKENRP